MALPYTFRRDKIGEIPKPPNRETYPIDELFCSFSGADIQCFIFGDQLALTNDNNWVDSSPNLTQEEKAYIKAGISKSRDERLVSVLGELQTITISSARSFGPVRRLGEIEPVCYKGGARTIAGTMVFAVMNKDVFAQMYQGLADGMSDNITRGPDFVDNMPPFHILIRGYNEYGASASALLIDVKITNFGTTFSVDDMFTESTYNYVAKHYIPFVNDWKQEIQTYKSRIRDPALPITEFPEEVFLNDSFVLGDFPTIPDSDMPYPPSASKVNYDQAMEMMRRNSKLPNVRPKNIFDGFN
jgi:hypothetical protein